MLKVNKLTIYNLEGETILKDVSFTLNEFEKMAIIGEEGNGKSTLLKAIYDSTKIHSYTTIEGTIDKQNMRIGNIAQYIDPIWNEQTIIDYLLKEHADDDMNYEQYNILEEYYVFLAPLQLTSDFISKEEKIQTLSGGEKVKLQFLKILRQQFDLLCLDEPTNDLDIDTLQWLEAWLKEYSKPVLFVTHDETLLQHVATTILHLEKRNKKHKFVYTIYKGTYQNYITSRHLTMDKDIKIAKKEKTEYERKQMKLNDIRNAVHAAQNNVSRQQPQVAKNLKVKMHSIKAQEARFMKEGYSQVDDMEEAIDVYFDDAKLPPSKVVLNVHQDNLKISKRLLLDEFHLEIYGSDKIVIVGNNGCGKSVLLKQIYQQLKVREDITLGYMPQNYMDAMNQEETPIAYLLKSGDKEDYSYSAQLLGRMKFTYDEMTHCIRELSEGQKAKLYILKFIKNQCNVLLLDEPTRNLSPLSRPAIHQLLADFQGCMIAVSHDRVFIDQVFHKRYRFDHQHLIVEEIKNASKS